MNIKLILKENILQLLTVLRLIFPKNKKESILLLFFLCFYLSYSLVLLFQTSLIDHSLYFNDLYLGFDGVALFHEGKIGKDAHPLLPSFLTPIIAFGDMLASINFKYKGIFFVMLQSLMISIANLNIFRYLYQIIRLNKVMSFFLTLMFAFLSTNLILAFTIESYTIASFLLTLSLYASCKLLDEGKNIKPLTVGVLAIVLGGSTTSNVVKGCVPYLFNKESFKKKVTILAGVAVLFLMIITVVGYRDSIFTNMFLRYEMFNKTEIFQGSYFDQVFYNFFGFNILFSELTAYPYTAEYFGYLADWFKSDGTDRRQIVNVFYTNIFQYIFVISIYSLVLVSFIKNYKNRFVHILFLLFLVDIFLHVILKFGLAEGFIYGGNFVYVLPLMLGWLYKSLQGKSRKILQGILLVLFVILIVNNFSSLYQFYELAVQHFPPTMSSPIK